MLSRLRRLRRAEYAAYTPKARRLVPQGGTSASSKGAEAVFKTASCQKTLSRLLKNIFYSLF
jgi:hypothetical protein